MKHGMSADALRRGWRRLRDDSGAAAVEFALILPLLVLLMGGIIEFGRAWNVRQALTDAAREGARVAVVNNTRPAAEVTTLVTTTVRERAASARLNTTPAYLKFEPALSGMGGTTNTPATVSLRYEYTPLFGTWILSGSTVPIRTSFVMRNE